MCWQQRRMRSGRGCEESADCERLKVVRLGVYMSVVKSAHSILRNSSPKITLSKVRPILYDCYHYERWERFPK